MKNVILLLFLMLFSSLELYSQKKISNEYLESINFKRENYDFQFICLDSALKCPNPNKVYELYLKNCLNDIKSFPKEIFKFKNLQVLIIEGSDIQTIPSEINELKNLEVLTLNHTNIVALPATIGELQRLKHLDLSDNKLESLPNSIGQLKELEILNLANNKLKLLPTTQWSCNNLHTIYLSNNPLSRFPSELLNLSESIEVYWDGNNCNLIPKNIGLDILRVSSDCDAYPFLEPHLKRDSKSNASKNNQSKDKKGN